MTIEKDRENVKTQISKHSPLMNELQKIGADIDKVSGIIVSALFIKMQIESLTKRIDALQKKRVRKRKSAVQEWEFLEDTSKKEIRNNISKKRLQKIMDTIVNEDDAVKIAKHVAEPTGDLANILCKIGSLKEQLYDITKSKTKVRRTDLDYAIKRLRKHFIEKTGRPHNDLIAGLLMRFNLINITNCEGCKYYSNSKCLDFLKCKKAKDRVKQRVRSLIN